LRAFPWAALALERFLSRFEHVDNGIDGGQLCLLLQDAP